ncbi:TIR domain-containing protein [Kibdelosporangium persicum]|uniref:Nucleotide-binding protein with TIR-like domain n=1 Tax=Kibdelosporangium persicum TaxID=2698649 RepID=A0ABX2FJ31_9PSEU|nr:TIR domain-containing protein [Kibdelosporangium persicum]NRN71397.1 putative nucleotide-binding protein with TIR-like domain [Kibdelosporangium persicum]
MNQPAVVLRFADDVNEADRAELDAALQRAEVPTTRGVDLGHRGQAEYLVLAVANVAGGIAGVATGIAEAGRAWLATRRRPSAYFEIEDRDTHIVVQISAQDPDRALQRLASVIAAATDSPIRWQGGRWRSPADATSEFAKTVFVVAGRDKRARRAMYDFLRAIGLHPIEWNEALAATGQGSPYLGEVLDQVLGTGAAVIVLQTPDDEVRLKPEHADGKNDPELALHGQARPNVLLEAGMALARCPETTVIVEFGKVRPFSDIAGRYVIRLDDTPKSKHRLAERLKAIGCAVDTSGSDWLSADLTPPGESPSQPAPATTTAPVPARSPSQSSGRPVLDNFSVTRDSLGHHTVHGEIRNNDRPVSWLTLKATFYAEKKITGTAVGVVRDLEPDETKTFSLTTADEVYGYDDYKVQIDSVQR